MSACPANVAFQHAQPTGVLVHGQVLELSKGAQIELEVLTSLVAGVLARRSQHEAAGSNATVSDATQAGLDKGIGEALKAASTSATSPPASLWAMRAQFHR